LKRLVYTERHEDIRAAIQREKNIKHWPRLEDPVDPR
jgi:putative endonuclease